LQRQTLFEALSEKLQNLNFLLVFQTGFPEENFNKNPKSAKKRKAKAII